MSFRRGGGVNQRQTKKIYTQPVSLILFFNCGKCVQTVFVTILFYLFDVV